MGPFRAAGLLGLLLVSAGCTATESGSPWETAWGPEGEATTEVRLVAWGSVARKAEGELAKLGKKVDLQQRLALQQLGFARAQLAARGLVAPEIGTIDIVSARTDQGVVTIAYRAALRASRTTLPSVDDGSIRFDVSLPLDPGAVMQRVADRCANPASSEPLTEQTYPAVFDPSMVGCDLPVAPARVQVVQAFVRADLGDGCRVDEMAVAVDGYQNNTYGFSFVGGVEVLGQGLRACEIRQLFTGVDLRYEWDGSPSAATVAPARYRPQLQPAINTGAWVTDTGGDWRFLRDDTRAATLHDTHVHNVTNREGNVDARTLRTEVQRNDAESYMLLQVRGPAGPHALHLWSYRWTNEPALIPGRPYAGADLAIGRFSRCTGITGLGDANDPPDGCL